VALEYFNESARGERDETVGVSVSEDHFDQLLKEAEEYGVRGRATLLRIAIERVREFGDGNAAEGLAKLQMAQSGRLVFDDSMED
jgi:hypothetical protein